jgi:O-antigen/teichoic acid export membrane protein
MAIGEEGVGIYNFPYPFFAIILSLLLGWIQCCYSKLVAEFSAKNDSYHSEKVFRLGMRLSLILGFGWKFAIGYYRGLSHGNMGSSRSKSSFLVSRLGSNGIFNIFSSGLRGYFQGLQNMKPNAASQLIEQICRIFVMLVLSLDSSPLGLNLRCRWCNVWCCYWCDGASLYLHWLTEITRNLLGKLKFQKRDIVTPLSIKKSCDMPFQLVLQE